MNIQHSKGTETNMLLSSGGDPEPEAMSAIRQWIARCNGGREALAISNGREEVKITVTHTGILFQHRKEVKKEPATATTDARANNDKTVAVVP